MELETKIAVKDSRIEELWKESAARSVRIQTLQDSLAKLDKNKQDLHEKMADLKKKNVAHNTLIMELNNKDAHFAQEINNQCLKSQCSFAATEKLAQLERQNRALKHETELAESRLQHSRRETQQVTSQLSTLLLMW